nr:hypothetical protein [Deltaproteobacteria bacterium]
EKLPGEFQKLFLTVAQAEAMDFGIFATMEESSTLDKMREYGNIVQKLPREIEEAYGALYDDALDEEAADKPDMKEMLEAQRAWAVMWNDTLGMPSWAVPPEEWR